MKRDANILCWETPRSMKRSKRGSLLAKITTKERAQATVLYIGVFQFVWSCALSNIWRTVTDKTSPRHNVTGKTLQERIHSKRHLECVTSLYRTSYKTQFHDHLHIYKNLTGFSK